MKLAYLILIHKNAEQFKRLFRSIYRSYNYYLVHVDKKSDEAFSREIESFLAGYPNASMLTRQRCVWGGWSQVSIQLEGIKELLNRSSDWDFLVNLSGQDFPLKSQEHIITFLNQHKGKNFLNVMNQAIDWPQSLFRIRYFFFEFRDRVVPVPARRRYLKGITPFIGSTWFVLDRMFCGYLSNGNDVRRYERYYRHTLCPDESFFQTVAMNSDFRDTVINDYKRLITFETTKRPINFGFGPKGIPRTYTRGDYSFLVGSDAFFARKFDDSIDSAILDKLEENLRA
jgi:hypothetical protein